MKDFVIIEHPELGKIRVERNISKSSKSLIERFIDGSMDSCSYEDEYYGLWDVYPDGVIEIHRLFHVKSYPCCEDSDNRTRIVIEKVNDILKVYPKSIYSISYNN